MTGPVQFRHTFKDFTKISFMHGGRTVSYWHDNDFLFLNRPFLFVSLVEYLSLPHVQVHTCRPAMGISFAAGTTDGPGDLNVKQGVYNPIQKSVLT